MKALAQATPRSAGSVAPPPLFPDFMSAELAEIAAVEGRHAEIQKKMAALEVELAAVKASNAEALAKVEALQAIALALSLIHI